MNDNLKQTLTSIRNPAMDELAEKHQRITEKYKDYTEAPINDDAMLLVAFNGYYALENQGVAGAFISVDTNMHKHAVFDTPIFEVELIICLDGQNPITIPFEGPTAKFDGTELTYGDANNPFGTYISLRFTRPPAGVALTALVAGNIRLETFDTASEVVGSTYNNPISYESYIGSYHTEALDFIPGVPSLGIGAGYDLSYNYPSDGDLLTKVPSFTYNLNMYFFSFAQGDYQFRLIMGTSAGGGLVCNDMTIKNNILQSQRNVQTTSVEKEVNPHATLNFNSKALATMSGFYPLRDLGEGAYICIEGLYAIQNSEPVYQVKIGVSTDGINSNVYLFDDNMSWDSGVLTMSIPSAPTVLTVALTKNYQSDGSFGSLTNMEGTVFDALLGTPVPVNTTNTLNPVPLGAFGDMALTNPQAPNIVLTINSDFEITYNGIVVTDITYVPMMYIAVFKDPENPRNTILLSLGTDGQKGIACIVTNVSDSNPPVLVTSSVWALPNATVEQAARRLTA